MNRIVSFLILTLALWALWLVFAGNMHRQELIAGGVVAVLAAAMTTSFTANRAGFGLLNPKRVLYALFYIPFLVWSIILSNLDVARRVLSPRLDINPGIVRIRTRLKNPVGRMILANSITLTPGTLSVDIVGDYLYIHWVDVKERDTEAASQRIAASFEKYLEVIFG
jgi:multicomponent Na+:H+ antiporter subunit E